MSQKPEDRKINLFVDYLVEIYIAAGFFYQEYALRKQLLHELPTLVNRFIQNFDRKILCFTVASIKMNSSKSQKYIWKEILVQKFSNL